MSWSDVDIAICTVQPRRSAVLGELLGQLAVQAPGASVRVEVQEPGKSPRERVRRLYGRASAHLVALDDDVVLAPDWGARVLSEIEEHPGFTVAWFERRDRPDGVHALPPGMLPGAFLSCPRHVARAIPDLADLWWRAHPQMTLEVAHGTDIAIASALDALEVPVWLQTPSAVQHRTQARCPSTQGERPDRISESFLRVYGPVDGSGIVG